MSLSDFTDDQIAAEYHRRALLKLGDPRKAVCDLSPTPEPSFRELVHENKLLRIAAGFTEIKTHG